VLFLTVTFVVAQEALRRRGGLERAGDGREMLWPRVRNARRRQKRQHPYRCRTRKCQQLQRLE